MQVSLWEDPQAYIRNSTVFSIDSLQTPLLLEEGDADGNVNPFQSQEVYNFGRRLGKNVVYLVYEGENHNVARPESQADYTTAPARVVRPLSEGRAGAGVDHRWRELSGASENSEGRDRWPGPVTPTQAGGVPTTPERRVAAVARSFDPIRLRTATPRVITRGFVYIPRACPARSLSRRLERRSDAGAA